jgi:hypothetical protein
VFFSFAAEYRAQCPEHTGKGLATELYIPILELYLNPATIQSWLKIENISTERYM